MMTVQIPGPDNTLTKEQPGGSTSGNNVWWSSDVTPETNTNVDLGPPDAFWELKSPGYGPDYDPTVSQSSQLAQGSNFYVAMLVTNFESSESNGMCVKWPFYSLKPFTITNATFDGTNWSGNPGMYARTDNIMMPFVPGGTTASQINGASRMRFSICTKD